MAVKNSLRKKLANRQIIYFHGPCGPFPPFSVKKWPEGLMASSLPFLHTWKDRDLGGRFQHQATNGWLVVEFIELPPLKNMVWEASRVENKTCFMIFMEINTISVRSVRWWSHGEAVKRSNVPQVTLKLPVGSNADVAGSKWSKLAPLSIPPMNMESHSDSMVIFTRKLGHV